MSSALAGAACGVDEDHAFHGAPGEVTREGIATITGFPSPDLFDRFGLPPVWD